MTLTLFAVLPILWAMCAICFLPLLLRHFASGIVYTSVFQVVGFGGLAVFFAWFFRRQIQVIPHLNYRPQASGCRSLADFLGWRRVEPSTHIRAILLCLNMLVLIAFGISPLVLKYIGADEAASSYDLIAGHALFPTVVLCFALIPAVCEELLFRGLFFQLTYIALFRHPFLSRSPRQRAFAATSRQNAIYRLTVLCLSNSLLFAFLHGNVSQGIIMMVIGLVLCLLRLLTGSILPGMIYHFWNNMLVLAVMQADPYAPPNTSIYVLPVILGVFGAAAIIVAIYLEPSK